MQFTKLLLLLSATLALAAPGAAVPEAAALEARNVIAESDMQSAALEPRAVIGTDGKIETRFYNGPDCGDYYINAYCKNISWFFRYTLNFYDYKGSWEWKYKGKGPDTSVHSDGQMKRGPYNILPYKTTIQWKNGEIKTYFAPQWGKECTIPHNVNDIQGVWLCSA